MQLDRETQTKHKERQLKLPAHQFWISRTVVHAHAKVKHTPKDKTMLLIEVILIESAEVSGFHETQMQINTYDFYPLTSTVYE